MRAPASACRRRVARQAESDAGRRGQSRDRCLAESGRALSLPVHQIMLVVNGIHLLENLKLDELAAGGAHEFAFIVSR